MLFFNWYGYRLFISFLEYKENTQLETQLDKNNFDETQLVSVKISAKYFSAYVNEKNFQRIDGQININGIVYNYVKIRMYSDSLEMLCIPNQYAMKLSSAKDNFFKLVNDVQHKENKKSNSNFSKNISTDYFVVNYFAIINYAFFTSLNWPCNYISGRLFHSSEVLENPPEA